MIMLKGFLHVSEIIIVIMLVFVMLYQFTSIPEMKTAWGRSKLTLMSHDILYSMERSGINWFDAAEAKANLSATLPTTTGFALRTMQDVRPEIKVGCVCNQSHFDILQQEMLTDFDLNGLRRSFKLERIDPDSIKFSVDNDVIIFWDFPDNIKDGFDEDKNLRRYLASGHGVVLFSSLTENEVKNNKWHQDVFNLGWVDPADSSYVRTKDARFPLLTPPQNGYQVRKLFYHMPYELSPESSLVGYWRMNLGRGKTAWDTSFKSNHGVMHDANWTNYDGNNVSRWVAGKYGHALSFDGVDDYVEIPNHPSLYITNQLTIEAWVYSNENLGATKRMEWVDRMFSLALRNDERNMPDIGAPGPIFHANFSDGNYHGVGYRGNPPPAANEWHHYVGVFDTNTRGLELWVDGVLIDQNTSLAGLTIATNTNSVTIGGHITGTNYFNGTIDEVMIYNRALSPEEIEDHYERRFPKTQKFENFVSESVYPLDNSSEKIIVEQESRYAGGSRVGCSVPLAMINWAVEGKGRAAWMSFAPLNVENRQLLKSLVVWAAGELDYDVVTEGELKESVKASMLKVLNSDMYELVRVDLTLGYFY